MNAGCNALTALPDSMSTLAKLQVLVVDNNRCAVNPQPGWLAQRPNAVAARVVGGHEAVKRVVPPAAYYNNNQLLGLLRGPLSCRVH